LTNKSHLTVQTDLAYTDIPRFG